MKNIIRIIAMAVLMAGCTVQEQGQLEDQIGPIGEVKSPVFRASFEGSSTKTYLSTNKCLHWTEDDRLSIFITTYNQQYRFMGETGDNSGDFTEVKAPGFHSGNKISTNYAVYPYMAGTKISDDESITVSLPSVQGVADRSFGLGANTMVAVTSSPDDYFLEFRNLCGYLVLKLYGTGTVGSITLMGNNGEKLAGNASVVAEYGEDPQTTMSNTATDSITLDCGEDGVTLGSSVSEATEFWFCVPPVTFSKGFTVTVTDVNGETFQKGVSSSKTITRNVINTLAALQVNFTAEEAIPEMVDLGLSVKWASYNVGATKPEEYGDYFAWGETEPYYEPGYAQSLSPVWKSGYSAGYTWSSYKWCNGTDDSMTKYCTSSSYGTVDGRTVIEYPDDVAHVKWGGSWRMPTRQEFEELTNNCTWTFTSKNEVNGYLVTSNVEGYTDKTIFLPAAGSRYYDDTLFAVGLRGYYWSSSLCTGNSDSACCLNFYSTYVTMQDDAGRDCGNPVRPVYGNPYDPIEDPVLEFSANEFQVAAEGEELNVKVTHNYDYTVSGAPEWVVVDVDGDDCFITVAENNAAEARIATLEFASNGLTKTVTIAQEASEESGDPLDVGSNLSKNETANTYVVTKAGDYTFSAAVMGNGPEGYLAAWVDAQDLLGADQSFCLYPESSDWVTFTKSALKRAVAIILWEDGDCIDGDPKFNSTDKTIAFKANGNEGGALIALYNQYEEILWSWLIWCTDRPAEFTYTNSDGDQVQLMDRNLGATSASPEDGRATFGYGFNFGRKDPIRMQHNMAKTMKIPNSSKEYYETVQNPTKFFSLVGRDCEYFNGSIGTLTPDLWGDPYMPCSFALRQNFDQTEIVDVQKTIYDPCPPGYQVPPARVFDNIKLSDVHLVSNLGVNVDVTGGSTYFPFAGYGDGGDSHGQDNGWYGYPGFTNNGYREGIYCVKVWTATEGDSPGLEGNWLAGQAFSVSYNVPENNLSLIQHPDGNLGTNYNEHCFRVTLNSVRCMKSQK